MYIAEFSQLPRVESVPLHRLRHATGVAQLGLAHQGAVHQQDLGTRGTETKELRPWVS